MLRDLSHIECAQEPRTKKIKSKSEKKEDEEDKKGVKSFQICFALLSCAGGRTG